VCSIRSGIGKKAKPLRAHFLERSDSRNRLAFKSIALLPDGRSPPALSYAGTMGKLMYASLDRRSSTGSGPAARANDLCRSGAVGCDVTSHPGHGSIPKPRGFALHP